MGDNFLQQQSLTVPMKESLDECVYNERTHSSFLTKSKSLCLIF
jgi:hypothetical protein